MAPPPPTPVRRLPPHRARQNQESSFTPSPAISTSASPAPVIKTEPPVSPAVSVHSAIPPHQRAGPHAKLGPHAQKPSAAPHMQPSNQDSAFNTVQNQPFMSSQNVLVNLESPKSVDKAPALADPWTGFGPKVKTEPGTEHSSVHAESQISEATTIIAPASTTNSTASVPESNVLTESTTVVKSDKVRSGQHTKRSHN
jgi:hypothetical protein